MRSASAWIVALGALLAAAPARAQAPGPLNAITDVPGIEVGHHTASNGTGGTTGTTVIVTRGGAVAGVSQRGGAPGTRETDMLKPEKIVDKVHAVSLSGGSAYGLAAADGVMQCLESQGIGLQIAGQLVPVVPAAILFDPGRCAAFNFRPDASFGLQACQNATAGPIQMGNVGAGAGARSGGSKGGLGTASVVLANGVIVGAIVAVNSAGRTFDTAGNFFAGFLELGDEFRLTDGPAPAAAPSGSLQIALAEDEPVLLRNTTIAVVATNAALTKAQATKIAQMADDGFARAIRISHGTGDGDTIFALSTGTDTRNPNINNIGSAAADALSRAVVRAIRNAQGIHVPGCNVNSYCDQFPANCATD
jgi:L-aminopeptidase/D-esterase-like protein